MTCFTVLGFTCIYVLTQVERGQHPMNVKRIKFIVLLIEYTCFYLQDWSSKNVFSNLANDEDVASDHLD